MIRQLCVLTLFVMLLLACEKQADQRGIYYWKTTYALSDFEKEFLQQHRIRHIYLRLFDVDWNETRNEAVPIGMLKFQEPILNSMGYIPVVYLTNKTMLKITANDIPQLAKRMHTTIRGMCKNAGISFEEVQFDCDWTDKTKVNYFELLRAFRELNKEPMILSSTLRLHQVKYKQRTGIPPVDRVALMFYNMGDRSGLTKSSSILNADVGASYLKKFSYPLPITLALPVYGWAIQHRKGKPIRLVNNFDASQAPQHKLKQLEPHLLSVVEDFYYLGVFYMQGDLIKQEGSEPEEISKSIYNIRKAGVKPKQTILFHLDSTNLNNYSYDFIEEIYTAF